MNEQIRKRIISARVMLVLRQPFFGSLALRLQLKEDESHQLPFPTMGTDGVYLIYDASFIESLSQLELTGLIAHEVLHVANLHPWRMGAREIRRWNAACDHAINPIIQDCIDADLRLSTPAYTMKLPPGGLLDPQYRNMSAEQIYELLQPHPQGGGGYGPGGAPSEMMGGIQPPCSGDGDSDKNGQGGGQSPESLRADWEIATLQAAQAAKMLGKLPAGLERLIDSIKHPKVAWKAVLRRFVQSCARNDYSWRQPARRYIARGLYLPSIQSEQIPPVVIYWDTSGSRDHDKARQECASETTSVIEECKPEKTYIIYGDAKVQRVDEFIPGEPLAFRPKGGGGTLFKPIFDWIEESDIQPACFIGITDMDAFDWAQIAPPEYPVLWASTSRGYEAPFGEVIDISE